MLTVAYGRAGSGKTGQIMQDIKNRMVNGGESGMLLIVPEQYSHDAERQLCSVCGDTLSLHAEVLSFRRLCDYVFEQTGGAYMHTLGKSGQILVMHKALESLQLSLRVFNAKKTRIQMIESMLTVVNELKSMCMTSAQLEEMAQAAGSGSPLADKLRDFALIINAYDTILAGYGGDAAMRLTLLAQKIGDSTAGSRGHIYFDGFNDFTMQELNIIEALLKKGAKITVCLTCDMIAGEGESCYADVFHIPLKTAAQLMSICKKLGVTYQFNLVQEDRLRCPELKFLEEQLFSDNPEKFRENPGKFPENPDAANSENSDTEENDGNFAASPVTVLSAASKYEECQYAAALIRTLAASGYRWRDIVVMARDFAQYETAAEQVFEKYEIPYFTSGKVDIKCKPPVALIDAALETIVTGFEYKPIFRYLKTGLLPVDTDDIAMLENYVKKWNIRGSLWLRDWVMPPSGYKTGLISDRQNQNDENELKRLNRLRELVITPLNNLRQAVKEESAAEDKLRALYTFITDIKLPESLIKRAAIMRERGEIRQADEYEQLLDIIIEAMDQMHGVAGSSIVTAAEFRKITALVMSSHSVGVIPIALDRVAMGTMAMNRRRDIKCLIILGATDDNLPKLSQSAGVLSDNERARLAEIDDRFPSGLQERLYHEMNMLYSTVTLPSDKLIMIYNTSGISKPSFIVKKLCGMYGIEEKTLTQRQYMSVARRPYEELVYKYENKCSEIKREPLSKESVRKLYGNNLLLSASSVNEYYTCPYRYFLRSGLKLKPLSYTEFDAASAGIFIHNILNNVLKEITDGVGIKNTDNEQVSVIVKKEIDKYISEVLFDFVGKNKRFQYLFNRFAENVLYVVQDTVDELKCSKFTPAAFEMDISKLSETKRGFIDRVDIYSLGGKLYIRIIDYKTRKKAYSFELGDVLSGMDMQMLIYLFSLKEHSKEAFGKEIKPAGVLYVPARDVFVNSSRYASYEEIAAERQKNMKRSGLILDNPVIIEAMESGGKKRFLPLRTLKDGTIKGDSLVQESQIDILEKHVNNKIKSAGEEILSGYNACEPFFKKTTDNACTYCDYFAVCRFDEQMGDKHKYLSCMSKEEIWKKLEQGVKNS